MAIKSDIVENSRNVTLIPKEFQNNERDYILKESISGIIKMTKDMVLNEDNYSKYIENFQQLFHRRVLELPNINSKIDMASKTQANIPKFSVKRQLIESETKPLMITNESIKLSTNYYTFLNRKLSNLNLNKSRQSKNQDISQAQSNIMHMNSMTISHSGTGSSSSTNILPYSIHLKKIKFNSSFNNFRNSTLRKVNIDSDNTLSIERLFDLEFNLKSFDMESEVFTKFTKDDIKAFLLQRTQEIIDSGTENLTVIKSKKFRALETNQTIAYELIIKSLVINIKEKRRANFSEVKPIEIIIDVPFSLIPMFYWINIHYAKIVISQLLIFDESYTTARLDMDKLSMVASKFKDQILNNSEFREDSSFIAKESQFNNIIDIITPNRIFELTLVQPNLIFSIHDLKKFKKITFTKTIHRQLMLYIIYKNFVKWDFYLLNYLSTYKIYRSTLANFISKINIQTPSEDYESYEVRDHPEDLENESMKNTINLDGNIQKRYNRSAILLCNLSRFELILSYINKQKELINMFLVILPHKIEVSTNALTHDVKTEKFNFNFQHMLTLEKVKPYLYIEDFIKKCLNINSKNKTLNLNYQIIDNVGKDIKSCLNYKDMTQKQNDSITLIKVQ